MHIRGEDRANPALLILHGGPGGSLSALVALCRDWEKHFTVVQWDQRGSGKTFTRNGAAGQGELSIERMAQDGIEVVEHLRERLGQPKILIDGPSWGTLLGVQMAKRCPDLLSAYVGTGQVVDKDEKEKRIYADLIAKARAAGDAEALAALEGIGTPPFRSYDDLLIHRKWSLRYDVFQGEIGVNFVKVSVLAEDFNANQTKESSDYQAKFTLGAGFGTSFRLSDQSLINLTAKYLYVSGDDLSLDFNHFLVGAGLVIHFVI